MAKLYFRYGAMDCGKSTQLLQVAHNYEQKGMKVLIWKPLIDTKGNDTIVSRLGISRRVDYMIPTNESIVNKQLDYFGIDCILVDEAQFLTKSQVDELLTIATNYDIPIICYGIRTDFLMNGFEGSSRLLEIAHSLEELKTICECGTKAIANMRLVNGKPSFTGEQVGIDGSIDDNKKIEYKSVCYECFFYEKYRYNKGE